MTERTFRVAVVGATGLLGREILVLFEERDFPTGEVRLYADEEFAGATMDLAGQPLAVEPIPAVAPAVDVAFVCDTPRGYEAFSAALIASGAVVIDASGAAGMRGPVVLGPADVSAELVKDSIRLASPAARLVAAPVRAIGEAATLRRVIATLLVPASAFGVAAVEGLGAETIALMNVRASEEDEEAPEPPSEEAPEDDGEAIPEAESLAFRCEPMAAADAWTSGVRRETAQLLGSAVEVAIRAAKVPVFYGQAASISVEIAGSIAIDEVRKRLREAASIVLVEGEGRRTTFDTLGIDAIQVTGLREDEHASGWLHFWALAENVRQGAALPAVVLAESLLLRH